MRHLVTALLCMTMAGCDDAPPPKNPFEPPANAAKPAPKLTAAPKPQGPPELAVDTISAKVGYNRVLLDKPEGRQKLVEELTANKQHFAGREVQINADRKTQTPWVIALVDELANIGATSITINTETRKDLAGTVQFSAQSKASGAAPCSVVAMVLADRGTAVWKLSGGVASKRTKGFAGPDLTMTSETIERFGKACKNSSTAFVSGSEGIEWGLVYDLSAAIRKLQEPRFDTIALLREIPVAGRPVKLQQ